MMKGDTTEDDRWLTRNQRAAFALVAVVCILFAGAAVVTAQQAETLDDFEDGDVDGWVNDGDKGGEINAESDIVAQGNYSMEVLAVEDSPSSGDVEASYSTLETAQYTSVSFYWYQTTGGSSTGEDSWVQVLGSSGPPEYIYLTRNVDQGIWEVSMNNVAAFELNINQQSGWNRLLFTFDYENDESTVYTLDGNGDVTSSDSFEWGPSMEGATAIQDFRFGSAAGSAYYDDITLNATTEEPAPPTDSDLDLDAPNYMQHNETAQYSVTLRGSDVTQQANITPGNTDAVTFYPSNGTVRSTANTTLNDQFSVTASYDGLNDSETMTVASADVDNLDILPTWWKVNATVGDGMMLWLIVATLAAVVATRAATSFAGVGAYVMIMISGWVTGSVSDGVMVATILTALFLGMNLAANVDTTIRGSG